MRPFRIQKLCLFLCAVAACGSPVAAQIAGNRSLEASTQLSLERLTAEVANSHITIDGTCQVRVKPTSMRLIWAVTSEESDAVKCRESAQRQIAAATEAWSRIGIASDDIVTDFISAIPRFEWKVSEGGDANLLLETQTGFRLQTNLHVKVSSDEQALQVIDTALAAGLTNLIGVDYAADLRNARDEARKGAIDAAKRKSELLLSAIFEDMPRPINVQEQTEAYFPDQMYDSFENSADQQVYTRYNDQLRRIAAYRPKNTYYRGLTRIADQKTYQLPMKPEIIVESKVVLYYQSPAAVDRTAKSK